MLVVHVYVHVKPDCVETFKQASIENARNSIQEPGIARFDVIQQADDPALCSGRGVSHFPILLKRDPAKHKETAHYNTWREAVTLYNGRTPVEHQVQQRVPRRERVGLIQHRTGGTEMPFNVKKRGKLTYYYQGDHLFSLRWLRRSCPMAISRFRSPG